ncbi:MAG: hypothetical protein ABI823_00720, partial [Bryobacteraceae bacterium]
VLVTYTIWPQAGGQGHLDLMPWYWKLAPPFAFSYAITRACIAAGENPNGWNRASAWWLAAALFIAGLIGGLTYYYHLQESQEIESDEGIITLVLLPDRMDA